MIADLRHGKENEQYIAENAIRPAVVELFPEYDHARPQQSDDQQRENVFLGKR